MPVEKDLIMEKKEGIDYPPIPKDVYQVELLDVNQETKATYDTRNKPEDEQEKEVVLNFQFVLLEGKDGDNDLRGRNIWRNFVPTYLYISTKNGKNTLYRIVEALLGRDLTREEEANGIKGMFLNDLIGKQCRISVEPKVKGEKTYDNITDFLKSNKDLTPLDEEEKDKATVKNKKEESEEPEEKEISIDELNF